MTIADILTNMIGVWEGTYTVVSPDGDVIERFSSRQEGRMAGTDWTEKVTYFKDDTPVIQYFHATVKRDDVVFGNPEIWGETARVGDSMIVFTFGWTTRPHERIVECSVPAGDERSRIWQHFEKDRLTKLTIIREHRNRDEEPERWYGAT